MLLLSLALYSAVLPLQLAQDPECVVCLSGFYPAECSGGGCASDNDSGSGSGMSGSGSGTSGSGRGSTKGVQLFGCVPCHPSCEQCFGPLNTQCYECANLSLLLHEATSSEPTNVSACNATETPRPVLQCVDECPPGSSSVNQQCTCLQGKYQNGSECLNCSSNCSTCLNGTESGCLTCSSYSYENSCVADCPSDTLPNDENQCIPVKDTLALSEDLIILIIISAGIVIILIVFVVTLFFCLGLYSYKKKMIKAENFNSKRNPVTLASSFRRVTADFGNHGRVSRDNFGAIESNEGLAQPFSQSLDPYSASNNFELRDPSVDEGTDQNTDPEEGEENMYVQMNPSCSSSVNSHGAEDVEPGPSVPIRTTSDQGHSGLLPPQSTDDNAQEYIRPKDMATPVYYANQAAIEGHLLKSGQVPYDESQSGLQDDTEQEVYEDMSGGLQARTPAVPPRSVLCAEPELEVADNSLQRHDTMDDDEYVEMTPRSMDIHNGGHSEQHSYVNVRSSQDDWTQGLTSSTRVPTQGISQPTYYNIVRNGASAMKHENM